MSTFSSANITDDNLVLKERTHRIKIKYSMHHYSIRLHNIGNWQMSYIMHSETERQLVFPSAQPTQQPTQKQQESIGKG